MVDRLAGKVALITGSTSGIGRATAELFAREGAKVVVNGRREELGWRVVEGIRAAGGEATFYRADVTVSEELRGLVQHAVDTYGRLDVLMNNAWSSRLAPVLELSEEDWDYGVNVILKATFLGCKYAIPHMIAQGGGSIINTSSVHGVLAARRFLPYEPAKAGLIHLTRQIAVDYGHQGIRVNAICPGFIEIERSAEWLAAHPEVHQWNRVLYPVGRHGVPMDIAYAALFLASDESSFITGHALMVDGGLTIQLQDSLAGEMARAIMAGEIDMSRWRELRRPQ
ncbi:MAG: glucose 1-dehydrogenase [Chloroflexi bacterium]|nr:glucose 1-dehydrogenase [Chloroflexota bacterium]